jgi:ABC-2 type transport system permease protein
MSKPASAGTPLWELTKARLREFVREPEAIFWTFIFPIVVSVAMAIAFPSRTATPVVVSVADGAGADAIRGGLTDVPGVEVRELDAVAAARALREGEVHLLVIPGDPPTYRFDPSREESRLARLTVDDALKRAAGRPDPFTARDEAIVVPGSRYIDWMVPGLIGLGIMSTGMWGVGFSIVQARMRKVLKLLVASPMRKHEYLAAQLCARLVFLAPEIIIPLSFAALALDVPVAGSPISIAVVGLFGALSFSAIGLLAASRARTFEAISGLVNLIQTPMWILSGVFFSSANFPDVLQPFIQALPLTALNDALRAVILEGAPLRQIAGELGILTVWAAGPFGIALAIFRWR